MTKIGEIEPISPWQLTEYEQKRQVVRNALVLILFIYLLFLLKREREWRRDVLRSEKGVTTSPTDDICVIIL